MGEKARHTRISVRCGIRIYMRARVWPRDSFSVATPIRIKTPNREKTCKYQTQDPNQKNLDLDPPLPSPPLRAAENPLAPKPCDLGLFLFESPRRRNPTPSIP